MIDNLRRDMVVAASGIIHHWTVEDIFRWPKTRSHPGQFSVAGTPCNIFLPHLFFLFSLSFLLPFFSLTFFFFF